MKKKLMEMLESLSNNLDKTHLRRNFVDALPKDIHSPHATFPSQGIEFCNRLFEMEKSL